TNSLSSYLGNGAPLEETTTATPQEQTPALPDGAKGFDPYGNPYFGEGLGAILKKWSYNFTKDVKDVDNSAWDDLKERWGNMQRDQQEYMRSLEQGAKADPSRTWKNLAGAFGMTTEAVSKGFQDVTASSQGSVLAPALKAVGASVTAIGDLFSISAQKIEQGAGALQGLREAAREIESPLPRLERNWFTDTVENSPLGIAYDVASIAHIEKMLFDLDDDIFIDRIILNKILQTFDVVIRRARNFVLQDKLRNVLSDMTNVRIILAKKSDRKLFIKLIRDDKEFLERLTVKYEKKRILSAIRDIVAEVGNCDLLNIIRNDEIIEDIFYDRKVLANIIKMLKEVDNKKSVELRRYIYYSLDRFNRSRSRFFNMLSAKEFEKIILSVLENVSFFLKTLFNYFYVRDKFGRKSSYNEELSGIKILRQSEIKSVKDEETGKESMACVMISADQKTRIENMYVEGNLFYVRHDGFMYP
ncbi:MAG TPA: hypothetical protein PLF61_05740, partial [Candidatus Goldiibacteriota bacterium]|nr:hypothetical protein [Candidatus Goldiibacteriota bacterium]